MTEKRFRKVLGLIQDNNGDLLDLSEIADKMNQLNDENEELKQSYQVLSDMCDEYLSSKDFLEDNCILCGANLSLLYKQRYGDFE